MTPVRPGACTGARMTDPDRDHMRVAIDIARRGAMAGEPPVGACLIKDGELIAVSHNGVIGDLDITAHAEIRVIREACRSLRRLDLTGCELVSTVEPCCMCLAASHYARISRIVYGASLADINAHTHGELMLTHEAVLAGVDPKPAIRGDVLGDECRALLHEWSGRLS